MAKNVIINEVTYSNVPHVDIPKADGSGDATFYDTSAANIAASDIRKGKSGFGANGQVDGNLETITATTQEITTKNQEITIAAGIHSGSGKVKLNQASVNDLIAANLKKGKTVLGVAGELSSVSVSQDSSTKALRIS